MFFREIKTIVLIYYYPLNLFSRANECEARESEARESEAI